MLTFRGENRIMKFDLAVVGNGAIGMMAAIAVARRFPSWTVGIVGRPSRPYSASSAAGAMINVYGEIEDLPPSQSVLADHLLEVGKSSSRKWSSFLDETHGGHIRTADDTLVVLKENAFDFEAKNFEAMVQRSISDGVGVLENPAVLDYFKGPGTTKFGSVLRILGEFAMDTSALLVHLEKLAKSLGIVLIDDEVVHIDCNRSRVDLRDTEAFSYLKVVVAAGAFTESLLPDDAGLMGMFQGVGTALAVDVLPNSVARPSEVVRTVNRGGAQCGVHLVPLVGRGLYIGAGNTVTAVQEPRIRFETVSYLLNTVQSEFLGRAAGYQLDGSIRLGLRPRSQDGFPLVGHLTKFENVFIATGTNRAGLTWAPDIADFLVNWLTGEVDSSPLSSFKPDRESLLLDGHEEMVSHYVESRIGAGLEHATVKNTRKDIARAREEIESVAVEYLESGKHPVPRGTHPDNWSAVVEKTR